MIDSRMRRAAFATLLFALAACASHPQFPAGTACETNVMTVTDDFAGARRGECTVLSDTHVQLDITPEDEPPINDSPWYAFRIEPARAAGVRITLHYSDGHHRYRPKTSPDGTNWSPVADAAIESAPSGLDASFDIDVGERPLYVAAEELLTPSAYEAWLDDVSKRQKASVSLLGQSLHERPVYRFDAGADARDVLFIVGRQHPPEVSGGIAFMAFADTLLGDSELAQAFRARFRIVGIPLMNPDGVAAGNWRHNMGGVDLNRDWGPFTQPETRLVRDVLDKFDAGGQRPRLFLDFHSTNRNVFYTQNDDFVTDPPRFMASWLERAGARIDDYEFRNEGNPVSAQANSKNYMYRRYGIPTATYEVGDDTDRAAIRRAAAVFAEELMTMLLDVEYAD